MRIPIGLSVAAVLLVHLTQAFAHSEHERPRYVAASGTDAGNCAELARPCRTIGYAVLRAAKGDRILVAAGLYSIASAEELFSLISGAISIRGGYSRYQRFRRSEPSSNDTLLIGAPSQYRSLLASKGFRLIADGKARASSVAEQTERLVTKYQATQKSRPAQLNVLQ